MKTKKILKDSLRRGCVGFVFLVFSCKSLKPETNLYTLHVYDQKKYKSTLIGFYSFFEWDLEKKMFVEQAGICNLVDGEKDYYNSEEGTVFYGKIKCIKGDDVIVQYYKNEGGLEPSDPNNRKMNRIDTINLKSHFVLNNRFEYQKKNKVYDFKGLSSKIIKRTSCVH
ncbi:hypothetical protein [Aquimarina sp. MMG016]|uniref:hypothetical protein n=1 Tax=Aquimarina sp. MMG016 TaxID=2822690 RepID=UPI001B3A0028|nr:hypothetical protein [Aquimarina sp. MMG016]MBQ4819101.1 hypothetical protein [Aquimarina sp. MMG016]